MSFSCWLSTDREMVWSFIGPIILIIIVSSYINWMNEYASSCVQINTIFLISTIYHILRSKATGGAEFDVKKINIVKWAVTYCDVL